jgi:hypothetical protein
MLPPPLVPGRLQLDTSSRDAVDLRPPRERKRVSPHASPHTFDKKRNLLALSVLWP